MEKLHEFAYFLESIRETNPDVVDSVHKAVYAIFEASKKKNKGHMTNKSVFKPYRHPRGMWGGWQTSNYDGGIASVNTVSDIGMGMPTGGG